MLGSCTKKAEEDTCRAAGNACEWVIDGYYIASALCTVIGLIWFRAFYHKIQMFQKIPRSEWRVMKQNTK